MPITRKSKKVTLQDIARRVNLSASSVSLALRGHSSISHDTKLLVAQIAQEMGYKPVSKEAPMRPHREPVHIAYCLIGESLQDVAYTPLAHGIIKGCRFWQAHLAIEQLPGGVPERPIVMPTGNAPSGYILAGFLDQKIIDFFEADGKPVIVSGINQLTRRFSNVRPDLQEATRIVAEQAVSDGYRNFVHITANLITSHNQQFLEVARAVLKQHGHSLPDSRVVVSPDNALHQPELLEKLSRLFEKNTAILTAGEQTASTCATILHTKGWIERFGLGIYSLRASDAVKSPPLFHGLNIGIEEVGQISVDRLIQKVLGYESCQDKNVTLISPRGWLPSKAIPAPVELAKKKAAKKMS